jgi:hypothetical protein
MASKTSRAQETMESPARNYFVITPHDSTDFVYETRGIWVGVGGTVVVIGAGDYTPVTFLNVASGTMMPLRAVRVDSTGTTATDLVGVY